MTHQIILIPGDGIGPEITKATTRILEHSGVKIHWEVVAAGMTALKKYRDPLPQEVIDSIDKNCVVLKGPMTTPVGKGFRNINVQNIANPSALILAAVMMLEYLDEHKAAKRIEREVARVIEKGEKVTKDINTNNFVGTAEFADAVIEEL